MATDGAAAFRGGRYGDAIGLFSRAEALVHAPPHLLYIARAEARLGHLVNARETYMKITREQLPAGAPNAFVEAHDAAVSEQASIEPRLVSLTINVTAHDASGANATRATVTMDGAEVSPALVGVAHPADPGPHTFHAAAPGWASDDVKVTLVEGSKEDVTLDLKRALVAGGPPTLPAAGAEGSAMRTAGWIALGVGVIGAGVGTFFVVKNHSKRSDADDLCGSGVCPAANRAQITSLDKSADSAATLAWVGYGVGLAGAGVGATLLFLAGSHGSAESRTRAVRPWVGPGSAGLEGRF
jgi:hypothetical protein